MPRSVCAQSRCAVQLQRMMKMLQRKWTLALALAGVVTAALPGCRVVDLYERMGAPPEASAPESGITRVIAARMVALDGAGDDAGWLAVIDAQQKTFQVQAGSALIAEGRVSNGDLLALQRVLEATGFYDLDEDYSPLHGCCGVVHYVISVERDNAVFSVRTLSATMPEAFRQVLEHIESLTAQGDR